MGTQTPLVLHPSQAGPFSSFTPAQVSQCPSLSSARHHLTPNLHVSLSSEGLQEAQEDASSLTRSDLPTLATATIQQLACPHWLSLETPQHRDRSPLSPAPGWWPGPGGGGWTPLPRQRAAPRSLSMLCFCCPPQPGAPFRPTSTWTAPTVHRGRSKCHLLSGLAG